MRRTILPGWLWVLVLACALAAALKSGRVYAASLYQAEADGARIVLTDEACRLQAVSNLKRRATWTEKGETFEGCYGLHEGTGLILAYFSDKTVVILPPQIFSKVLGA